MTTKEYRRLYKMKYPEKIKQWQRAYYLRHREKILEKNKNNEKRKLYLKEYYIKNRDKKRYYDKLYYQQNKEKLKQKQRTYYYKKIQDINWKLKEWARNRERVKKFREKYRENLKRWRKNNKLLVKLERLRRRCNFKTAGELSIQTIQRVYEDNIKKFGTLTCEYCLKPIEFGKDTLDHRIPLSRGGTNAYSNLAIACLHCNCKKFTKTEEEFRKLISATRCTGTFEEEKRKEERGL